MTRPLILLFAFALSASAQSNTSPAPVPISGKVLNAATGAPIPGAIVHYRGEGISFRNVSDKLPFDPATLQGQVTTGPDGSYATPPLPAFGNFIVHASAPGFFSAKQYLQDLPARFRHPNPLLPPGYHGPPPAPRDGIFHLTPDPIDLRPMSDPALANFALPLNDIVNRDFLTSAFAPGGNRLAFLTRDSVGTPPVGDIVFEPFRRCAAWQYNLKTGVLNSELGLPQTACDDSGPIVWDGDTLYIALPAGFSPPTPQAAGVKGSLIQTLPVANLPKPVQDAFAQIAAEHLPGKNTGGGIDMTRDGRFSIEQQYGEGRGDCGSLTVTSKPSGKTQTTVQTIALACLDFTYLLDPSRDLLIYTQPTQNRFPNGAEDIVEFDLTLARKRTFSVPSRNYGPSLLAEQALPGGATRVAYTINGDCDFNDSDYS